jgi:hypothetical protein
MKRRGAIRKTKEEQQCQVGKQSRIQIRPLHNYKEALAFTARIEEQESKNEDTPRPSGRFLFCDRRDGIP